MDEIKSKIINEIEKTKVEIIKFSQELIKSRSPNPHSPNESWEVDEPTICGFGPDGENQHATNEFVYVNSIIQICKIYALTAFDFLK